MTKKKIAATVLSCVIASSFFVPLTSCTFSNDKLPEWDANVTVSSAGATVKWNAVEGAKLYKIYHAPSKFGTYTLESEQKGLSYKNADKYGYYRVDAEDENGKVISSNTYSYDLDTFGPNTHIYASTDPQAEIQKDVDAFKDATSQFGEGRYAGLFKSGKYNDLDLVMRYYMTIAGLGEVPTAVELGHFNTYGELSGGNATCNFWCGIENVTVNDNVQWAVSQATSFRRMQVNGNLTLHDTGNTPWASGGFISDTVVTGTIDGSVQQQWFTRNSEYGKWSGCDINMVFSGCKGTFADTSYKWPSKRITELETTRTIREKPYLVFDNGYYVYVPELKSDSKGVSWSKSGITGADEYLEIGKDVYVARSDRDTSETLNKALKNGKHILFTPGIYQIDSPLLVEKADTVLMGIGLASLKLTDKNKDTIMRVSDVDGVKISGIMFDAGTSSKTLLELGEKPTNTRHDKNPTILNDVFFRIGGAASGATSVDTTLLINSNDVVGDNFWVWRADHGNRGTVGWEVNKTVNGVIVNGDYVTIYGLMVEHFHEYQTIWNGEYGFMAFYQSETPYDVDDLDAWKSNWNGKEYSGYASYKVSDDVQNHEAYGIGVYYVASGDRTFTLDHGVELPSNAGIHVEHMAIAYFAGQGGGITHIVNEYGKGLSANTGKNQFTSFIAGTPKE